MSSLSWSVFRLSRRSLCLAILACGTVYPQSAPAPAAGEPHELDSKIESLTKSLERTQQELAQSRTEIQQLRSTLEEVLKRMDQIMPTSASSAGSQAAPMGPVAPPEQSAEQAAPPAQISQDDWDVLNARVAEQRQTKVESASKFRLKLSGIALFNAFDTEGRVDNIDVPGTAVPKTPGFSSGAVGASVRQSIIGLTGYGPDVFGAKTSADLQMDFFGGIPNSYLGGGSGLAEIRLARTRFDWTNTSVVAGLDYLFFSPNVPSSYMSVAVPGFAEAGNLWTWTPTIRVEQRFGGRLSPFKVEAGLLDPTSYANSLNDSYRRRASATESSRQATYAVRLSANRKSEDRPASLGVSGIYSPQTYFNGYQISGWAGVLDWKFPLVPRTELSGQFFTGRGIDGFGGLPLSAVQPQNQYFFNVIVAPTLADIGVIGGWSQLKVRVNSRSEFNVAAGTGGRNSFSLRQAAASNAFLATVPARNEMFFVNYIFRPRSDLVFSTEYRRLRTYEVSGAPNVAGQVGLALGFLF
jgi:hypothetical protein